MTLFAGDTFKLQRLGDVSGLPKGQKRTQFNVEGSMNNFVACSSS